MNRAHAALFAALFAGIAASMTACGAGGASSPTAGEPAIASVWRSRCGQCHVPVEPGARARPVIDAAMTRHHKRLHLTEEQWSALADWLAPGASASASAPAPAPTSN